MFDPRLQTAITALYPHQQNALRWALSRPERFLLVNAPTGSGKTVLGLALASSLRATTSYLTQSIHLQEQALGLFPGLALLKGRRHHPCWIQEGTAETAPCAVGEACEYSRPDEANCPYYEGVYRAYEAKYRITNYHAYLNHPKLWPTTELLVCDEAHRVEEIVREQASVYLPFAQCKLAGIPAPRSTKIGAYLSWAKRNKWHANRRDMLDEQWRYVRNALLTLSAIPYGCGDWHIQVNGGYAKLRPVWGRGLAHPLLLEDRPKVLFMSATLMWPEWVATTLGLPAGSWTYLDIPSVFPPAHRPVYYAPVVGLNADAIRQEDSLARQQMQGAIDRIIGRYLVTGKYGGIVHTASHNYTKRVLTESSWSGIMTTAAADHAAKIAAGRPSVLVSPSLSEGWDGIDELCRFIIIPKVPFPDLGDTIVNLRMQQDARSYDYAALVSIIQAVGRGVRHEHDSCDAWILDSNWGRLYSKRRAWLPQSFRDAYRHNVNV